jgi:hypothetical protein
MLTLFYITVGALIVALLNLYIIISIRLKGYTAFYHLTPKDPNYSQIRDQYRRRSGRKAIAVTLLAIVLCGSLVAFEARTALHKRGSDTSGALIVGSALTVAVCLAIIFCMYIVANHVTVKR